MEIIKEIVRNIVVIVLLSVLLEMMMPNSSINRYVKLVMGLFIIVAVLNPILVVMKKDLPVAAVFSEQQADGPELQSLIEKGKALSNVDRKEVAANYQQKISQQVLALVRLNDKAKVQKVVVKVEQNPESANFGTINGIVLYTGPNKGASGKGGMGVEPVEIKVGAEDEGKTKPGSADPEVTKLIGVLADFYGISPENIKVENTR